MKKQYLTELRIWKCTYSWVDWQSWGYLQLSRLAELRMWVSEETFYWYFQGQYDMVHKHKTTTVMHILIKGPPSFSGPDQQILLPPPWWGMTPPRVRYSSVPIPRAGPPPNPPPPHTIEWLYPPPFLCFTSSYIVIFRSFRCTIPFPSFNSHPVLLSHSISFQTYLPGPNCFHQLHARTP